MESEVFDCVISDWMLPKKDGVIVLREFRNHGFMTSVLMLTAKDSVADRVEGLDAGADDYLTKPFAYDELSARVRALLRRNTETKKNKLQIADHVWNYDFDYDSNVVDVYVRYLRNKIDKGFACPLIHTVRGCGYVVKYANQKN